MREVSFSYGFLQDKQCIKECEIDDTIEDKFGFKFPNNEFKRMFVFILLNFIKTSCLNFCTLLGPRKAGKTTGLLQISEILEFNGYKSFYVDFCEDEVHSKDTIFKILDEQTYDVLLIDEITYINNYDSFIKKLNSRYNHNRSKTKIIMTGSSRVMITEACRHGFAGDLFTVNISFLNFTEYMVYKGRLPYYPTDVFSAGNILDFANKFSDITYEDYYDYISNSWSFSGFSSLHEYLASTLDEIVISNSNCAFIKHDICADDTNVDLSVKILCLCSLHNNMSWNTMSEDSLNQSQIAKEIKKLAKNLLQKNDEQQFDLCLNDAVIKLYLANTVTKVRSQKFKDVKKSLKILYDSRLVCFQFQNIDVLDREIELWLKNDSDTLAGLTIKNVEEFLNYVNVLICSPIPFIGFANDILDTVMSTLRNPDSTSDINNTSFDVIKGSLLGSYVETAIKGAYCEAYNRYSINEYHYNKAEIDIVDNEQNILCKISIQDKPYSKTWFYKFNNADNYQKYLIGKFVNCDMDNNCYRINYSIFTMWLDYQYQRGLETKCYLLRKPTS